MIKKIYNPLFEGDFIADVEAHTFDGATYFYGSTDNVPDEWCSDTYNVYSTNDFTKVHHHGRSLHINQLNCPTLRLMYAPDAIQKDGCTYLYICCDDNSEWVVKSRLPYSDFQEPIKLDALGIDPSIFIDDDGSVYYFWGQFFLNGAKLNDDMHSIDYSSMKKSILTEKEHFFHEGSSIRKRNGIYYLVFADVSRGLSEKYGGKPTCLGYATSTSPLGEYTYRGVIVDNACLDPESWNNHGSINQIDGQWYVFYHSSTNNSQYLRRSRVEKISFDASGLIKEVIPTSSGAADYIEPSDTIFAGMCCGVSGGYICTDGVDSLKTIKDRGEFIFRYINFDGENGLNLIGSGAGIIKVYFKSAKSKRFNKMGEVDFSQSSTFVKFSRQIFGLGEIKLLFINKKMLSIEKICFKR